MPHPALVVLSLTTFDEAVAMHPANATNHTNGNHKLPTRRWLRRYTWHASRQAWNIAPTSLPLAHLTV